MKVSPEIYGAICTAAANHAQTGARPAKILQLMRPQYSIPRDRPVPGTGRSGRERRHRKTGNKEDAMSKKLTAKMERWLTDLGANRNPYDRCKGRSEFGGANSIRAGLCRRGLIRSAGHGNDELTEKGEVHLDGLLYPERS